MTLKGKNVVITGGSLGIGFAVAEKCVSRGSPRRHRGQESGRYREIRRQAGKELGRLGSFLFVGRQRLLGQGNSLPGAPPMWATSAA